MLEDIIAKTLNYTKKHKHNMQNVVDIVDLFLHMCVCIERETWLLSEELGMDSSNLNSLLHHLYTSFILLKLIYII